MLIFGEGLIIGRIFAPKIWGAYFREGVLSEFYGILNGTSSGIMESFVISVAGRGDISNL